MQLNPADTYYLISVCTVFVVGLFFPGPVLVIMIVIDVTLRFYDG